MGLSRASLVSHAKEMADAIAHRGPDDEGVWCDPMSGLAMAHRRLAVVELSYAGHQPMSSVNGRYWIVFNGEIYNHQDLRRDLERSSLLAAPWRGDSDTETLLAGIAAWGLDATLQRCVGMFALAVWDQRDRVLSLARDRFGEKPLYWGLSESSTSGLNSSVLLFASELCALRALSGFRYSIDRESLTQLLRFGSISAPRSIYTNIHQLLPGHIINLQLGSGIPQRLPVSHPWWCLRSTIAESVASPFTDQVTAVEAVEAALNESVRIQSQADVPLGSFLSGGIDSTLITALLQINSSKPVRTFTIGLRILSLMRLPSLGLWLLTSVPNTANQFLPLGMLRP